MADECEDSPERERHGCRMRLHVDRRHLEYILRAPRFVENGRHLFARLAQRHGIVSIGVDPNFKVGAKSKKEPTVWVHGADGQEAAVEAAMKDLTILFDVKTNRVSMRVHIPSELHFAIIGKQGVNVKEVMGSTGCHVHFPDSDRGLESPTKCQVAISGTVDGVEGARVQLRGLMPFVISFDVPRHVGEVSMSQPILALAAHHHVTIFFRRRPQGPLALIKATRSRAHAIEAAAADLMAMWHQGRLLEEYTLHMEVSSALHPHLLGPDGRHLMDIMASTGTIISLGVGSPSTVTISGPRSAVKETYVVLQGHLPLVLSFDLDVGAAAALARLAAEARTSEQELAACCAMNLHAEVHLRPKPDGIVVTIRGIEAYVSHLYRVRLALFKLIGLEDTGSACDPFEPAFDAICDDPLFCPPLVAHTNPSPDPRSSATTPEDGGAMKTHEPAASAQDKAYGAALAASQHLQGLSVASTLAPSQMAPPPPPETRLTESQYEVRRQAAIRALQDADFSHERKPTSYFVGTGFSRSMPEGEWRAVAKEKAATPVAPSDAFPRVFSGQAPLPPLSASQLLPSLRHHPATRGMRPTVGPAPVQPPAPTPASLAQFLHQQLGRSPSSVSASNGGTSSTPFGAFPGTSFAGTSTITNPSSQSAASARPLSASGSSSSSSASSSSSSHSHPHPFAAPHNSHSLSQSPHASLILPLNQHTSSAYFPSSDSNTGPTGSLGSGGNVLGSGEKVSAARFAAGGMGASALSGAQSGMSTDASALYSSTSTSASAAGGAGGTGGNGSPSSSHAHFVTPLSSPHNSFSGVALSSPSRSSSRPTSTPSTTATLAQGSSPSRSSSSSSHPLSPSVSSPPLLTSPSPHMPPSSRTTASTFASAPPPASPFYTSLSPVGEHPTASPSSSAAVSSPSSSSSSAAAAAAAPRSSTISSTNSSPSRPLDPTGRVVSDEELATFWSVASLPELLTKLDLSSYASLFADQEIDLATFLTLDQRDLTELGVTTFGALRRMLNAIKALRGLHQNNMGFLADVYAYRGRGSGE